MSSKASLKILFVAGLCAVFSGCAHYPGGISASTTPLEGRRYSVLGRTSATDSRVNLLGILPITPSNSLRRAVDAASMQAGGEALIDVTVESYFEYWILFSRDIIKVDGIAIRFED